MLLYGDQSSHRMANGTGSLLVQAKCNIPAELLNRIETNPLTVIQLF